MRIHNVPYFIINPIYSSNNISNIRKKIEIYINIMIFLSFIWFFFFIQITIIKGNIDNSFLYLQNEQEIKNDITFNNSKLLLDYELKENNNQSLRELTTFFQGEYSKEDFIKRKQIKNIIDKLINTKYRGRWFTKDEEQKRLMIGDSIEGFTKLKFSKATEVATREDALAIIIDNLEDKYINHWIHHTSFILNRNLLIKSDKKNKKITFIGKWETQFKYGELFLTKVTRITPCQAYISIDFPISNVTIFTNLSNGESFTETFDTIDNSNFSIRFNSSCGFNMSMEIYPEIQKNANEIKNEVNKYVIILSIILILNMLSIYLMNNDLKKNSEIISCISLFSLIQNINWHVYCCMTHITWSITNYKYIYHFSIIALLYIFTIIGFDFGFIYNYWKIKKDYVPNRKLLNLKICFYFSFYLCFFISFFIISDVMIYYPLIIISAIVLWTPQILHNAIYYNKYNYPFFYTITSSIERLFFGFYFRGYNNNFYRIKGDKLIYIIILYFIINIIILVLQTLKGPRFFMPKIYQKEDYDFYKTKDELLEYSSDISNNECVICLLNIFCDEPYQNNDKKEKEKEKEKEEDNNNCDTNSSRNGIEISINELNKDKKSKNKNKNMEINILTPKKINKKKVYPTKAGKKNHKIKYKFIFKEIFEILFLKGFSRFYRIEKNPENKKYMRTPCNHVFHTICLEKWFSRKKECPNCRNDLSDKIF